MCVLGEDAKFTMKGGKITGNTAGGSGGGVYVVGGEFTMSGGKITKNNANIGGGVCVEDGKFKMTDGTITDNTTVGSGGGVFVRDSEFTMSGAAQISKNTATTGGGGVNVTDGTFTMESGTINDNTSGGNGGGVYLSDGTFTMNSGTITDNAATRAGGVYVDGGTFTMEGGTITDNTANYDGGGVYVVGEEEGEEGEVIYGKFNMSDTAEISQNKATEGNGGGVFVDNGATFNLSGSPAITGNTADYEKNNVYLLEGIMINITGELTNGTPVGVTMEKPGVFTTGLSGNGSDKNFSSDDTTYAVGLTDEREAFLGYTVTIADGIQNGTVSADKTVALLEDTVTLTVTPATGYELDTLTVKQGETAVTVSDDNEFTMPAGNVTVSTTFTLEDYTVTVTSGIEHGTVSADKTEKVHMGDTVTLTVAPATGYKLATLTVKQGETAVTVTNNSFTMPAGNVTVSATFTLEDYTVTVTSGIENGTVSADKTEKVHMGDTVTLTVTPATGYELGTLTYTMGSGSPVNIANNQFTMPAGNVTVSATFKQIDYNINKATMTNGDVTTPATANYGDTVTLTVTPATGYKLATLTVKQGETAVEVTNNSFTMPAGNVTVSATFTLEDYTVTVTSGIEHGTVSADRTENVHMGDTITLTVIPDKGYRLATLTVKQGDTIIDVKDNSFTMPSGNVTVNAEFVRVYTVTFDSDGGSAVASQTVDAGKNASKPAPDPTKNKAIFQNWYKVTGDNMAEVPFDFGTAINEDTTLKAKWKYATVLKTGGEGTSENGSIGIISGLEKDNTTGGYYGTPGGEVELELKPNEGCVLTGLEINGEDVLNGVDENGHYTFDMPEEDVTINAKFEKAAAALSVQLTAKPPEGVKVGDTITFTATVTNTGNVSVTGGTLESALSDLSGKTFALAPRGLATFTYTYTVTQAIFDSEEVVDTVKANATAAIGSNPAEASATATVSSKKLYTITTDSAITGGSVTPSLTGATGIPATKAPEGETVHLGNQANSGYEFSRYVVTNANGGAVTLDEGDESFTMPAGNVTVSAKFRKVPGVSVTGAENLTYNGKAQALIASAGTDAGKLEYAVTDAQTQPTGGWDDKIPTRTDAGTYIVWYRVQGNDDIVGYPSALRATAFERNPLPHRHDTSFDSTDRL